LIFAIKQKIHYEANFLPLERQLFFACFGPKMDQKRANPQYFGAIGLCINVTNDPRRERKEYFLKEKLSHGLCVQFDLAHL